MGSKKKKTSGNPSKNNSVSSNKINKNSRLNDFLKEIVDPQSGVETLCKDLKDEPSEDSNSITGHAEMLTMYTNRVKLAANEWHKNKGNVAELVDIRCDLVMAAKITCLMALRLNEYTHYDGELPPPLNDKDLAEVFEKLLKDFPEISLR